MAFFKDLKYFSRPGSLEKAELTSEDESSQSDRLLEEEEYRLRQPRRAYGKRTICGLILVVFLTAIISFFLGLAWQPNMNKQCMKHTAYYCMPVRSFQLQRRF